MRTVISKAFFADLRAVEPHYPLSGSRQLPISAYKKNPHAHAVRVLMVEPRGVDPLIQDRNALHLSQLHLEWAGIDDHRQHFLTLDHLGLALGAYGSDGEDEVISHPSVAMFSLTSPYGG